MNTYEYNEDTLEMLYDTVDALTSMMEGDKDYTSKDILHKLEEIARYE
ncbi:MAG: hypothetical protein UZ01_00676 [Candidatus Brocadia sinica]|uniref:Uncharacterized protein n=1 Tax=Candidatus Brocadia sinica JPN1 TaxID=1197129 RepID=A0ABQ0K3N9_9BACT|nr:MULTISPECIES: hypothetical protein [Brocadia]KXK32070.1 MAG: hypothetical protein UZ01_00676 [Candidatus Brocadia sinica]NOG43041.1 hypothetical protein [Planctomycetota bacterium]MCK6469427.1 hypothetical protein [Candidatus Brocadia sinica]NUO05883.1 hypothetical protein [Candidatus Brocadia sinica]GAN35280.1 hypothetical protein BROSI_A3829 [Candidatus Brocadia sinica JPN1]